MSNHVEAVRALLRRCMGDAGVGAAVGGVAHGVEAGRRRFLPEVTCLRRAVGEAAESPVCGTFVVRWL